MANHVHLLVVPERTDSMGLAMGNAHGKYAQGNSGTGPSKVLVD